MKKYLKFKEEILNEELKLKDYKEKIIALSEDNNVNFNEVFNTGKELYVLRFKVSNKIYEYTFLDLNLARKIERMIDKYNNDFKDLIYKKMDILNFDEYDKWEFRRSIIVGVNEGIVNILLYRDSLAIRKEEEKVDSSNNEKCPYCGDGGCFYCEPNKFIEGFIYN